MRSLESPLTAIHEHRTATLAADEAVRLNGASGGAPAMPMSSQWTPADRRIGMWSCYLVFALGLAYVPTMIAGFVAVGGLSAPIPDPYLAAMELLILLLAPTLVVAFAALALLATLADHQREQPGRFFSRRPGPARPEDRGTRLEEFRLHEQIAERRMRRVGGRAGEHQFGITRQLDHTRSMPVIGERDSPQLHIVLR